MAECIGRVHRQSVYVEWCVERCVERRAKRFAQCWSFTAQPVDPCAPGVWGIRASGGMPPTPARSTTTLGKRAQRGGMQPPSGLVSVVNVQRACVASMEHGEHYTLNEEKKKEMA